MQIRQQANWMFYCIFNHVVSCCSILSTSPMIPSQRQMWRRVLIMSSLLIVTCGIFLCQPTVNEKQYNLSILCSGRTGRCWWLLVRRFWQKQELSARREDNRAQQTGWCAYKDILLLSGIAETILPFCRQVMVLPRASAQRKRYLS